MPELTIKETISEEAAQKNFHRDIERLDRFILRAMQKYQVAGCSLAVIWGDQVIHLKGYGKRNIDEDLPVDVNTIFAIASATKAFTTLDMGILVDRGLLDWDTPVREYVPWFKLYDSVATQKVTPRDLASHRTGLPRHDLMWYGTACKREELMKKLPYLEPNKDFRSYLQYQNLMYMAAGYLIEVVSGLTWEAFTRKEIFEVLCMQRSNTTVEDSRKDSNASRPYDVKKKKIQEIPFKNIEAIGPAGGINSSAQDLARWVVLHLNGGKVDGKQIVSAANLRETHRPNMVITGEFFSPIEKYPEYEGGAYGLGWFNSSYRGRKLIHHGGNIDGFSSLISFLPNDNLGIAILSNQDGSMLPLVASFHAYDLLLGLEPAPWLERGSEIRKQVDEQIKAGKSRSSEKRVRGTRPSHRLEDYVGLYEHPGYGTLKVTKAEKGLSIEYNGLVYRIRHYHYDIFEMEYHLFDLRFKANFATDAAGNIASVALRMEPQVKEIVFARRPEEKMFEKSFLEQFTGEYDLLERSMLVALREDALFAALPGQPEVELAPYQGMIFKVKNTPAITFEFKRDQDGKVSGVDIEQMNMVVTAKKR